MTRWTFLAICVALAFGAAQAEQLGLEWSVVPGATAYELQFAAQAIVPVWQPIVSVPATGATCAAENGTVCRSQFEIPDTLGDPFLGRVRAKASEPASVGPWSVAVLPRATVGAPTFLRRATVLISADFRPDGSLASARCDLIGLQAAELPADDEELEEGRP